MRNLQISQVTRWIKTAAGWLIHGIKGTSPAAQQQPLAFLVVRVALLAAAVAAAVFLINADAPWQGKPIADPQNIKLSEHVRVGFWLGVAASLILCLGLFATCRWWMLAASDQAHGTPSRVPRMFWWLVIPVIVVAAWLRAPLLSHSVYGDELYSITRFIHGEFKADKDGQPRFREATWTDTLWGYRRPNNHVLFSISARVAHEVWRSITGADRQSNSVPAMRAPALIASLLSILLAAYFLWTHGHPGAALLAAALMALHPWHIAHSVEVRGYSFVFLFGIAVLVAAAKAMDTGRWKWWGLLAAAQFCLLLTYPSAVYLLVPLVAILVGLLWQRHRDTPSRMEQIARLLVVNVVMTAALLPMVLPCVPQLSLYLAGPAPKGPVTAEWVQDVISLFLSGTSWHTWDASNPICYALDQGLAHRPPWPLVSLGFLAVVGIAGYARLFVINRQVFCLLLPFWMAPFIALGHATFTFAYLYTWYLIFSLPVWLICSALGMEAMHKLLGRRGQSVALAGVLPMLALFVFAWLSQPQRSIVRAHSAEPLKEVTTEMHRLRAETPTAEAILAVHAASLQLYDPFVIALTGEEHLKKLQQRAKDEGKPIYLALSYLPLLKASNPAFYHHLMESGDFELMQTFYGLDFEHRNCVLLRYQPQG